MEIDLAKYIEKINETARKENNPNQLVHCEHLKEISDDLYINEKIEINAEENSRLLNRILEGNEPLEFENDEWQACVDTIENLFQNNSARRAYIRDIEVEPAESNSLLANIHSHISVDEGRNREVMEGINTPMHYIGEMGSFTVHHEEDGGLSSINLLKCGDPKLWFVLDCRWRAQAEKEVAEYLRRKFPDREICNQILQHKIYLVTPKLLMELNIPCTIVLQKPGDLFFIRKGTYHAVINMGRNVAEAINYGCDAWNFGYEPLSCSCEENKKHDIEQDRTIVTTCKTAAKRLHECNIDDCGEIFVTLRKLEIHKQMKHLEVFRCETCNKNFANNQSLKVHMNLHSEERQTEECDICHKKVLELEAHKRRNHGEKMKCSKCSKMIGKAFLKKHEKTCIMKCPVCAKVCSNSDI